VSTCPPLTVEPPSADPFTGGLFAAAATPVELDPHWECGIRFEENNCATPVTWEPVCPPEIPEAKPRTFTPQWVEASTFPVVLGVDCSLPGMTLEEFRRRLVSNMQNCAQTTVERAYMTGELGNTGFLASPDCAVLGDPANPLNIVQGLAALESYLGTNYCGVGVIHAPAAVTPLLARYNQITGTVAQPRSWRGTRYALGNGYEVNVGPGVATPEIPNPAPVPAPDGVVWLYATGRVGVWRSEIFVPNAEQLAASLDRRSNEVVMYAEQMFAIAHECACAAVPVTLGCGDC
jgi:hypothetical protein